MQPSDEFLTWLGNGGYWQNKPIQAMDQWIEGKIDQGHLPFAVKAYANALRGGGNTLAECYGLARDFDCAHLGVGFERWPFSDIPQDRWFRDAWRRSHNGGPIKINMDAARSIQFRKIKSAVVRENKRRSDDIQTFDSLLDVSFGKIVDQIQKAKDVGSLRLVWPMELPTIDAGQVYK
jgi:hypothetical protein